MLKLSLLSLICLLLLILTYVYLSEKSASEHQQELQEKIKKSDEKIKRLENEKK